MKCHIGVDTTSGLVHSLVGKAANVANVNQVDKLLHGAETYVSGDSGYTGAAYHHFRNCSPACPVDEPFRGGDKTERFVTAMGIISVTFANRRKMRR
jgi:IS5 family transposase